MIRFLEEKLCHANILIGKKLSRSHQGSGGTELSKGQLILLHRTNWSDGFKNRSDRFWSWASKDVEAKAAQDRNLEGELEQVSA